MVVLQLDLRDVVEVHGRPGVVRDALARLRPPARHRLRLAAAGERDQVVAVGVTSGVVLAVLVAADVADLRARLPLGQGHVGAHAVVDQHFHGQGGRHGLRRAAGDCLRLGSRPVIARGLEGGGAQRHHGHGGRGPEGHQHRLAALLAAYGGHQGRQHRRGQWFERERGLDLLARHPAEQPGQAGQLGDGATAPLAPGQVALELQPVGRREGAEDVGGVGVGERALAHARHPHLLEGEAQGAQRVVGAGLHGSFRDVELAGGVGDRHAAVVAAHEDGAVVVAQPRERVGDHPRQQQLVGVVARDAGGLGRLGDGDLGAGALGAPLVDGEVAGHGEQPRADRPARLVEQPRAAPGPQQGLLEEVFGVGAVMAGQPQAVAPERAGVLVVQLLHQRHRSRAGARRPVGTALGHVTSSPRRNVSGVPTVQSGNTR